MMKKDKTGGLFRNANVTDFLVVIVILNIMAVSGISLYFYYKHDVYPTIELLQLIFAFFGTELLAMATIKVSNNIGSSIKNRGIPYREREDDFE